MIFLVEKNDLPRLRALSLKSSRGRSARDDRTSRKRSSRHPTTIAYRQYDLTLTTRVTHYGVVKEPMHVSTEETFLRNSEAYE